MLDDVADEGAIEELAEKKAELASAKARELVARRPDDESAAALLKKVVRLALDQASTKARRETPAVAPTVVEATRLIGSGDLEQAEILLRQHLRTSRNDPPAMHLMAEVAARCGFREDAERILKHSANLHFNSPDAMADLGRALHRIAVALDLPQYIAESLAAFDRSIAIEPGHEAALAYKSSMLVHERGLDRARKSFEQLVAAYPHVSEHWMNYGFLLKTIGEFGFAVAAYRTAIALDPLNGAAWFGLANMKLGKFFAGDIDQMTSALQNAELSDMSRVEVHFALAKSLDDARDYERAAGHLSEANRIRSKLHPPDPELITKDVDFVSKFFTRDFFSKREGWGISGGIRSS